MTDKIAQALDMDPLAEVMSQPSEVVPYHPNQIAVATTDYVDPQFEQACQDFEEVRDNMRSLIHQADEMFQDAKGVAVRNQDPDSYNASARFLELAIRANRELLSTHRDIFAMRPPVVTDNSGQQAEQINNVFISTSGAELLEMLAAKGIGIKR